MAAPQNGGPPWPVRAPAGAPTAPGFGGAGYALPEAENDPPFEAGVLSMAKAGERVDGSQFFITLDPAPTLNDDFTVFGRVIEGMDVLRELTARNPAQPDQPAGDRILDVGCGSGILSVVAVKLGAASAVGLEIDPVAARAGEENARINGLEDKIQIVQGTLPSPMAEARGFDIVAANISARGVTALAEHLINTRPIG